MQLAFPDLIHATSSATLADPAAYRGLYAFHKYWGKKPAERCATSSNHLCPEGGLVVDPFSFGNFRAGRVHCVAALSAWDINPRCLSGLRGCWFAAVGSRRGMSTHTVSTLAKDAISRKLQRQRRRDPPRISFGATV